MSFSAISSFAKQNFGRSPKSVCVETGAKQQSLGLIFLHCKKEAGCGTKSHEVSYLYLQRSRRSRRFGR